MANLESNEKASGEAATNEREAREMTRKMGVTVLVEEGRDSSIPLDDDDLEAVSGGTANVGEKVMVSGNLYTSCYAEVCCGQVNGMYSIQQYLPGRAAPYLLKSNLGWVKTPSVTKG